MGGKATLQASGISPEGIMSLVRSMEEMGMEVELVSALQGQAMDIDHLDDDDLEDQMQYEAQVAELRAQMELEARIAEAQRQYYLMAAMVVLGGSS
jgi:hypothetical protein